MPSLFVCNYKTCRKFLQAARLGTLPALLLSASLTVHAQAGAAPSSTHLENRDKPGKAALAGDPHQTLTLVGAGDIATCKHIESAKATAKLIDGIPGTVFAAGDLAYDKGSPEEFKH